MHPEDEPPRRGGGALFPTTDWTLVVRAGGPTTVESRTALNELCRAYWYPVYAFLRRKGVVGERAQDLTQSLFARLLANEFARLADPARGRFRSFLLGALEHLLTDEWRRDRAQKRGGDAEVFSIDESEAEGRYDCLPRHEANPLTVYDRAWAAAVIEQARHGLERIYERRGKLEMYRALAPFLARACPSATYDELVHGLGVSRDTLQQGLSRLRDEFGACLRREVARTVDRAEEVEDEIRYLLAAGAEALESSE